MLSTQLFVFAKKGMIELVFFSGNYFWAVFRKLPLFTKKVLYKNYSYQKSRRQFFLLASSPTHSKVLEDRSPMMAQLSLGGLCNFSMQTNHIPLPCKYPNSPLATNALVPPPSPDSSRNAFYTNFMFCRQQLNY